MKQMILPALLAVIASASTPIAAMEENWTLELDSVCDQAKLQLPLPALDMSCDLDKTSGNPSKWFNPYETCEFSFDMIGLPSLGDILGGISGKICEEIKEIKDQTIDDLIDEVNEQIPDNITDDLDWGLDLNEEGGLDSDWRDDPNAKPDSDNGTCYTHDFEGNTITVPCDIAESGSNLNQCYFKSNSYSNPFTEVECGRYTVSDEICITGWSKNDYGESIPSLGKCTSSLRIQKAEACYVKNIEDVQGLGGVNYCSELTKPVSQNDRICQTYSNNETKLEECITIEKFCYGHLNGNFQANSCRKFHDQFFSKTNDPFSNYGW